jgi:hypothetical protein
VGPRPSLLQLKRHQLLLLQPQSQENVVESFNLPPPNLRVRNPVVLSSPERRRSLQMQARSRSGALERLRNLY